MGNLQVGVEECDDGNDDDGDSCTNGCRTAQVWRRIVVQAGVERGVGADNDDQVNTTACTVAACGDGFVQGNEACDDGNEGSNRCVLK